MRTLGEARADLTARLGELSTDFWSEADRNSAINDAQRFISAVTKGVYTEITGIVSSAARNVSVALPLLGSYSFSGTVGDRAVSAIPISVADAVTPSWRRDTGTPRWALIDAKNSCVWVSPAPSAPTTANLVISVVPPDLTSDGDVLFLGREYMGKYLNVVTNYAAAMCLLRERFDGDAERFYQLAVQELGSLGVDPGTIPNMPRAVTPQEG